ncbi:hypothetical protein J6590_082833 [Homalodisca vitripennis]|nr:hypothetical protein J6590_082833 [Homalodisca vitripennis]
MTFLSRVIAQIDRQKVTQFYDKAIASLDQVDHLLQAKAKVTQFYDTAIASLDQVDHLLQAKVSMTFLSRVIAQINRQKVTQFYDKAIASLDQVDHLLQAKVSMTFLSRVIAQIDRQKVTQFYDKAIASLDQVDHLLQAKVSMTFLSRVIAQIDRQKVTQFYDKAIASLDQKRAIRTIAELMFRELCRLTLKRLQLLNLFNLYIVETPMYDVSKCTLTTGQNIHLYENTGRDNYRTRRHRAAAQALADNSTITVLAAGSGAG